LEPNDAQRERDDRFLISTSPHAPIPRSGFVRRPQNIETFVHRRTASASGALCRLEWMPWGKIADQYRVKQHRIAVWNADFGSLTKHKANEPPMEKWLWPSLAQIQSVPERGRPLAMERVTHLLN
ncbi:hypothetical protein, partial [Mesorhizobium sp. M1365]